MKKTYKVLAHILIPISAFLTSCSGFDIMNGVKPIIPHETSYEKNDKYSEIAIDTSLKNHYLGRTDLSYSGLEKFAEDYSNILWEVDSAQNILDKKFN